MICSNCKKIIAESSTKCPFCSEPFRENEGVVIKKHYAKRILLPIGIAVFIISLLCSAFCFITDSLRKNSAPLQGETFSNAKEALVAYDAYETKLNDTDLDYCPPYDLKHSFECGDNTILIYSSCYTFGGQTMPGYAIRTLEHNDEGELYFGTGFMDLQKTLPTDTDSYHFMNIHTKRGEKSLGIFYLPESDMRDVYFDGIKAKKDLVCIDGDEFYLCYALSKPDTTFRILFTSVSQRHSVEIK